MEVAQVLALSDDLHIAQFTITSSGLVLEVIATQSVCSCPVCGQPSDHIHSRYRRVVADVPCGNRPVRLRLEVRKFFCRNTSCLRKIFTERLPELVQPSARMTNRLRAALQALGLASGGEVSARLAPELGMQAAPTTFLRCLRLVCCSSAPAVRVVGLDDWAYKRGDTYGTILLDLERHRVIDLLPDRTAATVKRWLEQHPEIEVISRDRAGSYADAARQGAPQALQVADRFHLIKNMRQKIQELLDRRRSCLPFVQEEIVSAEHEGARQEKNALQHDQQFGVVQPEEDPPAGQLTVRDQQRKQNRDKRHGLSEEVKD